MLKNHKHLKIILFVLFLGLNGCATIVTPKYQKIKVMGMDEGVTLTLDDKKLDSVSGKVIVGRDLLPHKLTVSKEGYKSRSTYLGQSALSIGVNLNYALMIFGYVPGLVGFLVDISGNKFADYPHQVHFNKLHKIRDREEGERFLHYDEITIDSISYNNLELYNFWQPDGDKEEEGTQYPLNEVFEPSVLDYLGMKFEDQLKKYGYADTVNRLFKMPNGYKLSFSLDKAEIQIAPFNASKYLRTLEEMEIFRAKTTITWKVKNMYGNEVASFITADIFSDNLIENYNYLDALENSIEFSLLELLNNPDFIRLLKQEPEKIVFSPALVLESGTSRPGNKLSDVRNSFVSLVIEDSPQMGVILSESGLILASIKDTSVSSVTVELMDGRKLQAEVLRNHKELRIAVLQLKNPEGLAPVNIPKEQHYEQLDTVYYATSRDGSNPLLYFNEGIISGIRKIYEIPLIQSDVSTDKFEYGGFLLDKNGAFLGVVDSKILGLSVDGISFYLPSDFIFNQLNIEIK